MNAAQWITRAHKEAEEFGAIVVNATNPFTECLVRDAFATGYIRAIREFKEELDKVQSKCGN
jgi:hypothetical protein